MTRQNVYNVDRLYKAISKEAVLRKHNGSIFSFLAVALVLVITTGLVVFAINNRSSSGDDVVDEVISQVDGENENKDKESDRSEESSGEGEKQERHDSSGDDNASNDTASESSEGSQDGDSETQSESPAPVTAPDSSSAPSTPSAPSADQGAVATELPETGLTLDILSSAIGILAIVGAGYIYYHFGRN